MRAKEPSPTLSSEELDDLQLFLKDWLRHAGRTQADLRRALRADAACSSSSERFLDSTKCAPGEVSARGALRFVVRDVMLSLVSRGVLPSLLS
jgi:hypothetical protein